MARRTLEVVYLSDTSDFKKGARNVGKSSEKTRGKVRRLGDGFGRLGRSVAAAGIAMGGARMFAGTIKGASDLEEQVNKTGVVFKDAAPPIVKWSKTTAGSIGIAQAQALEAAGVFGNMLVPMGVARGEAAGMSKRMVQLAGDMASFNNASPQQTLDALRSGLAGETEPLRRFGVFLNQARIKAEALELGLLDGAKSTKVIRKAQIDYEKAQRNVTDAVKEHGEESLEAREANAKLLTAEENLKDATNGVNAEVKGAAKAQAIYSLITKDTADAHGDFERTSDSLANRQRSLKAQFSDIGAQLGGVLLPAVESAAGGAAALASAFTSLDPETQKIIGTAAAATAGLLALSMVFERLVAAGAFLGRGVKSLGRAFMFLTSPVRALPAYLSALRTAYVAQTGITNASTAAVVRHVAAQKIATAATKVQTAAQGALNVVMRASPIYRVVAVIALLVGALVLAWKKSETFREVVLAVWDALKTAVTAAAEFIAKVVTDVWEFISRVTSKVWGKISAVLSDVWGAISKVASAVFGTIASIIEDVWNVVYTVTKAVWDAMIRPMLEIVWALIKAAAVLIFLAIKKVITTAWEVIKKVTTTVWEAIKSFLERLWRGIKRIAEFVWNRAIRPAIVDPMLWVRDRLAEVWGWVKDKAEWAWDRIKAAAEFYWGLIRDFIIDPIRDAADWAWDKLKWLSDKVSDIFEKITGFAGSFAGDIKGAVVGAFKGAINTIGKWANKILDLVDRIPGVDIEYRFTPLATGGTMSAAEATQRLTGAGGLARGGVVNRPQVLVGEEAPTHPEFVIPTNPAYRGRATALMAQAASRMGMPGFAQGGVVGEERGEGGGGFFSDAWSKVTGGASAVWDTVKDAVSWVMDRFPSVNVPDWIGGLPSYVIDKVKGFVTGKAEDGFTKGGLGSGGGKLGTATRMARAMGLMVTSGFRPGDPGWHGKNRARDYSNGFGPTREMMAFAQRIAAAMGKNLLELIYTPLGWSIKNGRKVPAYARAGHYDHVHVAMAQGGLAPGGRVRLGELGPEDVYLPKGSRVQQASESGGGDGPLIGEVNIYGDTDYRELAADLAWRVAT